jgi:hypothetical protein
LTFSRFTSSLREPSDKVEEGEIISLLKKKKESTQKNNAEVQNMRKQLPDKGVAGKAHVHAGRRQIVGVGKRVRERLRGSSTNSNNQTTKDQTPRVNDRRRTIMRILDEQTPEKASRGKRITEKETEVEKKQQQQQQQ